MLQVLCQWTHTLTMRLSMRASHSSSITKSGWTHRITSFTISAEVWATWRVPHRYILIWGDTTLWHTTTLPKSWRTVYNSLFHLGPDITNYLCTSEPMKLMSNPCLDYPKVYSKCPMIWVYLRYLEHSWFFQFSLPLLTIQFHRKSPSLCMYYHSPPPK